MPDESDSLDLSQLQFRPEWVDSLETKSSTAAGAEVVWGRADGRAFSEDRGGFRGPRRDGGFDRRDAGRGPRPQGDRRGPPPGGDRRGPRPAGQGFGGQNRGPRPGGPGGPGGPDRGPRPPQGDRRGPPGGDRRGPPGDDRRGPPRGDRREFNRGDRGDRFERSYDDRPPPPAPLAGWQARLLPEPRALEAMARQIRGSGRAYPIFDIARLFLGGKERFLVKLSPRPAGAKAPAPPPGPRPYGNRPPQWQDEGPGPAELFRCRADGSIWTSREEAIQHILYSPALESYYRKEQVTVEAPKGNFTSVAVCGFSGTILGPPNHHAYQHNVAKLHRERFSDMSLERLKSRIHIDKDEAMLQKWQEQSSTETHWVSVDPGEDGELARFRTGPEMEAHFMRTSAATAVEAVKQVTVAGTLQARYMSPSVAALVRIEVDRQSRFPMQLVQDLCRDLERQSLRFFKRDRRNTFVCRSRPHYLPDDLVLSDRIRGIVELVRANPGIDYARLVAVLAPPKKSEEAPKAPAAEPAAEAVSEPQFPAGGFSLWTLPYLSTPAAPAAVAADAAAEEEKAAPAVHLSQEEVAILQDLRWLMGEGYITEFNNGELHILGRPTQQPGPRRNQHYSDAEDTTAAEIAAEAEQADAAGEQPEAAREAPQPQPESAPAAADSTAEVIPEAAAESAAPPVAPESGSETAEAAPQSESSPETAVAPVWPSGPFTLWTVGLGD